MLGWDVYNQFGGLVGEMQLELLEITGVVRDVVFIISIIFICLIIYRTTRKINGVIDSIKHIVNDIANVVDSLSGTAGSGPGFVKGFLKTVGFIRGASRRND